MVMHGKKEKRIPLILLIFYVRRSSLLLARLLIARSLAYLLTHSSELPQRNQMLEYARLRILPLRLCCVKFAATVLVLVCTRVCAYLADAQ